MHVGAYITCARAHGGRTGGSYGGVAARGTGWTAVPHAGFVYPLARPCVISPGSILSTGTQFSRARCSFKFRFPAFPRPFLYARSRRPPQPSLCAARSRFLLTLRLIHAIHLSASSLAFTLLVSVVLYTFRSRPASRRSSRRLNVFRGRIFSGAVFTVDKHERISCDYENTLCGNN